MVFNIKLKLTVAKDKLKKWKNSVNLENELCRWNTER